MNLLNRLRSIHFLHSNSLNVNAFISPFVKRISIVLLLCTYSNFLFSQSKEIKYPQILEVKSMVIVNDSIFMVGCVSYPQTLKSYPVLICTSLMGDTLWTKEYQSFSNGGQFDKIIYLKDHFYVIGYEKSSFNTRESIIYKVTKTGEILTGGQLKNKTIEEINATHNRIYLAGHNELYDDPGSYIIKLDENLKLDTLVTIWRNNHAGSSGDNLSIIFNDTVVWLSGTYKDKSHDGFVVSSYSQKLDSLNSNYTSMNEDSECHKMISSRSKDLWTSGVLEGESKKYFLLVKSFNAKGDVLLTHQLYIGTRYFNVIDMLETMTGDILVLLRHQGANSLATYRNGKFYKIEELKFIDDFLPKQLLQTSANEISILGLGMAGQFYGKSMIHHWKVENQ